MKTEHGTFARIGDDSRRIRGLLLPYNEPSRLAASGTESIAFSRGAVTLPRDPSVVTLNVEHDRFNPIGRAVALEDTDAGVVAEFEVADTDEGDAYLADMSKRKLSAEVAGIVRDAADRVRGIAGRLTGAAVTTEGAFASAALFAVGDITEEQSAEVTEADPDVIEVSAEETPSEVVVTDAAGNPTRFVPADSEDDEGDNTTESTTEQDETMTASVPNTATANEAVETPKTANEVFSLITKARFDDRDAENLLAALSDIKVNASGGLTTAGSGIIQPEWVGEVYRGRRYAQKYIGLGRRGIIRAMDAKGFRLAQGTALVAAWSGNKTELPSGTASTTLVSSSLRKYGYAADIAREFFDLPGGEEVIAAFIEGVVESYAKIVDTDALADIVTAATANIVAPDTYPTDYPAALGQLIQGISEVENAGGQPTFAVMNDLAWKQALYTPKDAVPEFVTFDFNTTLDGTSDGRVHVVRGDIGVEDTAAVVVGDGSSIRFNEVGETPIQLEALDIARGGVDRAVVGYLQTLVEFPDGLVLVGAADE